MFKKHTIPIFRVTESAEVDAGHMSLQNTGTNYILYNTLHTATNVYQHCQNKKKDHDLNLTVY
jgi:hypothetical protein